MCCIEIVMSSRSDFRLQQPLPRAKGVHRSRAHIFMRRQGKLSTKLRQTTDRTAVPVDHIDFPVKTSICSKRRAKGVVWIDALFSRITRGEREIDRTSPSGMRWGIFSTKWISGIEGPWRPPCSKSTWRCGRRCWANRKRLSDRQAWNELRTRRSLAWCRGGRHATEKRAHLSCARRRKSGKKETAQLEPNKIQKI